MTHWFEQLIAGMDRLSPPVAYLTLFLLSYAENVLPPVPGDLTVVVGGVLVGRSVLSFLGAWLATTSGSVIGFMTYYAVGRRLGRGVLERPWAKKAVSPAALARVEGWFERFGFGLILGNRFLTGVRSVISLFAGMAKLRLGRTLLAATVGAGIWNALLLYGGMAFGQNYQVFLQYLATYGKIVGIALVISLIGFLLYRRRRRVRQG